MSFTALPDEYDPSRPNLYDTILRNAKKQQRAQQQMQPSPPPVVSPAAPSSFAMDMMQRMGWQSGKGLGRQGQGMTTPLVAEPVTRTAGLIKPAHELDLRKPTIASTRVIVSNLVPNTQEDEITEEALKFGNLVSVEATTSGQVTFEFETIGEAKKAREHFFGFNFKGKKLKADYA